MKTINEIYESILADIDTGIEDMDNKISILGYTAQLDSIYGEVDDIVRWYIDSKPLESSTKNCRAISTDIDNIIQRYSRTAYRPMQSMSDNVKSKLINLIKYFDNFIIGKHADLNNKKVKERVLSDINDKLHKANILDSKAEVTGAYYGDGKNIFQIVIHKEQSDMDATFVYKIK